MSTTQRALRIALATWALLVLGACAPSLPPVTEGPTKERHPGKFVWFDLLTEDPVAAERFYAGVFGWTFEDSGTSDYRLALSDGTAVAGVAPTDDRDADFTESRWLASISVKSVDAAARRAESGGGEVLVKPIDVRGRGRLAAVRDPGGAEVVLLKTRDGDPPDGGARPVGSFLWADLWTEDASVARSFYATLLGYEARTHEIGREHRYEILGRDGVPRAGLVVVDLDGIESNWLPYVRVTSVSEAVRRTRSHGGSVLLERGDVAVLLDPTGAAIGVQHWDGRSGS